MTLHSLSNQHTFKSLLMQSTTIIFKLSCSFQTKYFEFVEEMEARHIFLFRRRDITSSSSTNEMWGFQYFFSLKKNHHPYLKHGLKAMLNLPKKKSVPNIPLPPLKLSFLSAIGQV